MKNLFKTPAKKALVLRLGVIALFVVTFVVNLVALLNKLSGYYSAFSIWKLADTTNAAFADEQAFAFIIRILFFASLAPIPLAVWSLIVKKNFGFYIGIVYNFVFSILIIAFMALFQASSAGVLILTIVSIVLNLLAFGLTIWAGRAVKKDPEAPKETPTANTKIVSFAVLALDIIALGVLISLFFLPLYQLLSGTNVTKTCILFNALSSESIDMADVIAFLVVFGMLICCLLYFISFLSYFFSDKKFFIAKSKHIIFFNLVVSLAYFLTGYFIVFFNVTNGQKAATTSYIPTLFMCGVTVAYSILKGRFDAANSIVVVRNDKKSKMFRIEPLLFVLLVTAITGISLFLNIIVINVDTSIYTSNVTLTGIQLLQDHAKLGSGYQALTFFLVIMLMCSGIGLLLTTTAFFSKYKHYGRVAKVTTYLNCFFMLVLGISGFYFSIAQEINKENITKLLDYYRLTLTEPYEYTITTDEIYALAADVVVLVVMMFRQALDRDMPDITDVNVHGMEGGVNNGQANNGPVPSLAPAASNLSGGNQPAPAPAGAAAPAASVSSGNKPGLMEEVPMDFDPCPAFTELDMKADAFNKDLEERKKLSATDFTLNSLIKFIVEYARDSRLHLSYSQEDIATFVSGLAACRLSILQGMSGTGKTSLPKIFSEAIYGTCDIVEVESSWKDKNELLGYYNEFSRNYTPKKFTQALYKAALNKEIPTFIVLDEMNLSRIEYYFSDFLSLMENEEDKREIKLLNINLAREEKGEKIPYLELEEGHTLHVPTNVWFIGTANRDESTFVISDKVYDRAHTMNFNKRAPKVRDFSDPIPKRFYTYESINQMFAQAKGKGTFDAERNPLIKKVEEILSPFNISFGNRILKQIEDFVNVYEECFKGQDVENQAVETILLSKVVAKLEVKTIDNKDDLVKEFEALNLHRCSDFVSKLNED